MLKNLTIRSKLFAVLGLMAAVAVMIATVGVLKLGGINEQLNNIVDVTSTRALLAGRIQQDMLAAHRAEKNLILAETPDEMDDYAAVIEKSNASIDENLTELGQLATSEGKRRINEFRGAYKEFETTSAKVRQLSRQNTNKEAFDISSGKGRRATWPRQPPPDPSRRPGSSRT